MARLEPLAGERQKGETSRAVQGCNDYLRMGPGRTVAGLWRRYVEMSESERELAPSRVKGTLTNWSARYGWLARAEAYDAALENEKNARAEEIMNSGVALEHERVSELKKLAAFLTDQVEKETPEGDRPRVWLPDVKQIGSGFDAERVDIERFNAPLFSQLRGVLDDLAQETGGRVRKQEITGKDRGPIEFADASLTDAERLAALAALGGRLPEDAD